MQNKYLIKASRKFWFWYWTQLMNGFAPSDLQGNYKRPKGITINSEYDINNENGQIYLLVGHSCPCLLYTSPSPRDRQKSRMPSSA